jgi:glycosyltransferase involved in cell wall biosynthesis
MFGRGKGGIEQAFLDYTELLLAHGHEVHVFIRHKASIKAALIELTHQDLLTVHEISIGGVWDFLTPMRLRKTLKGKQIDCIICHGTRASTLMQRASKKKIPLISLSHNYSVKRLVGSDLIFNITKELQKESIKAGQPVEKTRLMPNMIRIEDKAASSEYWHSPPVIGSMGRFVTKKGFDTLLYAASIMKDKKIPFKMKIGGNGEEEEALKALIIELDLEAHVEFVGWVENKHDFFNEIDIFCLPSYHEPFGIVLLEAFAFGVPVLTTDSEGPSEIATHGRDAFIVPKGDAEAMAEGLKTLLYDESFTRKLGKHGLETVKKHYDIKVIGKRVNDEIVELVK